MTGRSVTYQYQTVPQGSGLQASRMINATSPQGTFAYTYQDDAAISPVSVCDNVQGGALIKTMKEAYYPGTVQNFYGPSKRVLKQILADGTELKFSYKLIGACTG